MSDMNRGADAPKTVSIVVESSYTNGERRWFVVLRLDMEAFMSHN